MISGAQNIFLDRDGPGEERGPSTYVRRYGGGRRPSSSSRGNSPENNTTARSGEGSPWGTPAGRSPTANVGTCGTQAGHGRKDKRLLVLLHPKEGEDSNSFFYSRRRTQTVEPSSSSNQNNNNYYYYYDGDDADENNEVGADERASQQGILGQPLEERFTLDDLRQLMRFFSTELNLSEEVMLQLNTDGGEGGGGDSRRNSAAKYGKRSITYNLSTSDKKSIEGRVVEDGKQTLPRKSERNSIEESVPNKSIRVPSAISYPMHTKEDLHRLLLPPLDGMKSCCVHETYTRVLSEREFSEAVKTVVPGATDAEIMELLGKVDYEAKGRTTWDDFSTFLVSQSRHRSQLVNGPISELFTTPEPSFVPPSAQHITGTCMESDARRKLLLTGGSEGTVRAWDLDTLSNCGVVFAGDCWVVGVHWANEIQSIFIVAMDRRVIVLDSRTLEVRRLYRGRAIVDSVDGYLYAHDSVQAVKVGGKIKPKEKRLGVRGAEHILGSSSNNGNAHTSPTRSFSEERKQKQTSSSHQVTTLLAPPGTGPYVQSRVVECILAGLVDSISCSLFHHSALREDMLILATVMGEVRFYVIPKTTIRVVLPHAVVRLHEERINKMTILFDSNALLTASDDGLVKMTSLETGALIRTFFTNGPEQHSSIRDFAIHTKMRLLVTVGPERYGIVWDFSHESPLTILDSHNSPCRCCAVHVKQSQIFTVGMDGTIFIFNTQGYRLIQLIHVHHLHPQCILYEEKRMRLLCLASYPYFHGKQQTVALACSNKYQGHMSSMMGVMYNHTYDLIITIDTEGLVMTWKRSNGIPVFAFQLKDFSDSAVMNAARLSAFAMDGLERRLLTGFQNGAVAVWNLINGQTTNVITAAAESFSTATMKPEVTSLGSLVRDGITFFFFSAAGFLLSTRESSTFTIASATKWEIPERYGDIIDMLPVSPQILVCATSSGALIFYHVLSERQVGSALWVTETSSESMHRPLSISLERRKSELMSSALSSRIVAIFPLQSIGEHILMSVHMDGTVVLWHTLRRLLMESVSVRSAFPVGVGETGLSRVSINRTNQYLVFADDQGNIHVCSFGLRRVHDEGCIKPPRPPQLQRDDGRQPVNWPGSPFNESDYIHVKKESGKELNKKKKEEGDQQQQQAEEVEKHEEEEEQKREVDEEKVLYEFSRFCQEYVFQSGFPTLSGVSVIDAPMRSNSGAFHNNNNNNNKEVKKHKEEHGKTAETKGDEVTTSNQNSDTDVASLPSSQSATFGNIIVASSGSDNFTRVFSLDGTIMGECGLNQWTLGKESTYEYLGEKPTKRLLAHKCCVETVDFLHETPAREKNIFSKSRRMRFPRKVSRVGRMHGDSFSQVHNTSMHPSNLSIPNSTGSSILPLASTITVVHAASVQESSATAECPPMHSLAAELQEWEDKHQQMQQGSESQERLRKKCLPQTKILSLDEANTLSTQIRSRRLREDQFQGLIKREFIPKLRGLPVAEVDDDLSFTKLPINALKSPHGTMRTEQSSDSSMTTFGINNNNNNNNNNLHAGNANRRTSNTNTPSTTGLAVSEGSTEPVEAQNYSAPPVFVVGGNTPHAHRPPKTQIGSVAWKLDAHPPGDNKDTAAQHHSTSTTPPLPFSSTNRPSAALSALMPSAEDETQRHDLIQEHMESQRRMLLSLGRTDPVLESVVVCSTLQNNNNNNNNNNSMALATRPGHQNHGMMETRDRIARITSRMYLSPVSPIIKPAGIRGNDELFSLDDDKKKTRTPTSL